MSFMNGRASPGPSWAALDEVATTPSSTQAEDLDNDEDVDVDELDSQSGYRSSTPLKRKNTATTRGKAKRLRREPPSTFGRDSDNRARGTGNSNDAITQHGKAPVRQRSESLTMDDLLLSNVISSQPNPGTTLAARSAIPASQPVGKSTDMTGGKHHAAKKRLSHPFASRPSTSAKGTSSSRRIIGGSDSEDNSSSAKMRPPIKPNSGTTLNTSRAVVSLKGKNKSSDYMDVDEQGSLSTPSTHSTGSKNHDPFFASKFKTDISKGRSKVALSSLSQPSISAPVKSRSSKGGPSNQGRLHGPASSVKVPGPKPRASLPVEVIDITDDDEPTKPSSSTSQSKGFTKKKPKARAKPVFRPGQEVLEVLDSDDERERGMDIARLSAHALLASVLKDVDTGTKTNKEKDAAVRVKKEPLRKRPSAPVGDTITSREPEVIVISDSDDEKMGSPSPVVPPSSSTSQFFNDPPPLAKTLDTNLTPIPVDEGAGREKEAELSQGVGALSLLEEDPMPLDSGFSDAAEPEPLCLPPETPSPPSEPALEHVTARAHSSPTSATSPIAVHFAPSLDLETRSIPSIIPTPLNSLDPGDSKPNTPDSRVPSMEHSLDEGLHTDIAADNMEGLSSAQSPVIHTSRPFAQDSSNSPSPRSPSEPLFLPSPSPSSSPSPPPQPREPPRRLQLARKSTGGNKKIKYPSRVLPRSSDEHSSDSGVVTNSAATRGGRKTSVSSEQSSRVIEAVVEPTEARKIGPTPTALEASPLATTGSSAALSNTDKEKVRYKVHSRGAHPQSIADAINLAGATNATYLKPRKGHVRSGSAPSSSVVVNDPVPVVSVRPLEHKIEGNSNNEAAAVTDASRASTDELALLPGEPVHARDGKKLSPDVLVTPDNNNIHSDTPVIDSDHIAPLLDDVDESQADVEESEECEQLLVYTDHEMSEDNSMARDSIDDDNLSDDPLARSAREASLSSMELTYPENENDSYLEPQHPQNDNEDSDVEPPPTPVLEDEDDKDAPVVPKTYGGIPALVWKQYRKNPENFGRRVYWAKDIPHALEDQINSMSASLRRHPQMRNVMLAAIRENTIEDEPDAPDIIIENEVDDEPTPPWEFHYSNQLWHGEGVPPPDMKSLVRCDCIGPCNPKSKTCACVRRQTLYFHEGDPPDFCYDSRGLLKKPGYPIFECNDACNCDDDCRNRVVQNGRTVSIKIAKTPEKGWGIFAGPRRIPRGTFLGIYSGEILTDEIGEQRGKIYNKFGRTYLFDIDFHHLRKDDPDWDNKYTVDAYHAGNFTRFLNHSCDPNARLFPCYINDGNIDKPLLCVFAIHDVEPDEEICFSYSGDYPDDEDSDEEDSEEQKESRAIDAAVYQPCLCGSKRCTGRMFRN